MVSKSGYVEVNAGVSEAPVACDLGPTTSFFRCRETKTQTKWREIETAIRNMGVLKHQLAETLRQ